MSRGVYKSESGRRIVEDAYRSILDSGLADGMERRSIDTPFARTFVMCGKEAGRPPLVLLHGSASNSASWLGVAREYARWFSVYCVDIPGEPGLSEPNRLRLASGDPGRWVASVLDALGIARACFVGMSLGGWYALDFAIVNPGRVIALSLVSSGGIGRQKYGFIFKALFLIMLGKRGQAAMNRLIYRKATVPKELLAYQAIVSRHFRPLTEPLPVFTDAQLAGLPMPIQYFGGELDALLDSRGAAERLRRLVPRAEAHLLPDTGHAVVDKFGEIGEFLARSIAST